MARSGVTDTRSLQRLTPGLSISTSDSTSYISLRGIGNNVRSIGNDPSVAVSLDDVYLPVPSMALTELFDVKRVEVLKGPQASLYGRSAAGGAINILSSDPDKAPSLSGYVGYGSFNLLRGQLIANSGGERISARVSAVYAKNDGYTRLIGSSDRLDQTDFMGIRGTIRLEISENFSARLLVQHSEDRGTVGAAFTTLNLGTTPGVSYPLIAGSGNLGTGPRDYRLNYPTVSLKISDIVAMTLQLDLDRVSLKSISGFTSYRYKGSQDFDGTSATIGTLDFQQGNKSWSQEFQVSSTGSGPLSWTGGLFFLDQPDSYENSLERYNLAAPNAINYFTSIRRDTARSTAAAVYGQASYSFTPKLTVTVGARYNYDEKQAVRTSPNALNATARFEKLTPSGQIQFRPNDTNMIYAGIARGYKSGGINPSDTVGKPIFAPEALTAYEAGFKMRLLDRKLLVNASVFYNDYNDIQLRTLQAVPGPNGGFVSQTAVTNAAGATVKGIELQLEGRLARGLSVDANGAFLDTSIRNFRSPTSGDLLNGRPLPMSPKLSGGVGANFEGNLAGGSSIRLRAEISHRSTSIFPRTYDAGITEIVDRPVTLLNATARWTAESGKYYVEAIGSNLTDQLYRSTREDYLPFVELEAYAPPRMVEVRVGFNF